MNNKIDLRFKQSQEFINTGKGKPVYKKTAFSFINKHLGPQFKWINKSPEEYFKKDKKDIEAEKEELRLACKILGYKSSLTFKDIKVNYKNLSKNFHPDKGGHNDAFAILNYAYNIFKLIEERSN